MHFGAMNFPVTPVLDEIETFARLGCRSLEVAAQLGAKKVVLHPSMASGMGPFVLDTVKGYAFEFLSAMVDAAHKLDVTICLENMFPGNRLGVEPEGFEEIFKTFPSAISGSDGAERFRRERFFAEFSQCAAGIQPPFPFQSGRLRHRDVRLRQRRRASCQHLPCSPGSGCCGQL